MDPMAFPLIVLALLLPQPATLLAAPSLRLNNGTDLAALLAFKAQLSDPLGILGRNWTTNTSFCHWVGVSCSRRRRRVTTLALQDMPLQGVISPYLGNLSFLHVLNLTGTNLTGSIPSDIGRLSRLVILDLSFNSLSGIIYHTIGNLTKLQALVLGTNELSGQIPDGIGSLLMLRVLDLRRNQLSGPVPPNIFNMSSLVEMVLQANNLTGPIPSNESFILPMLQVISLSRNKFTGRIPSALAACQHLETLDVGGNLFVDVVPTWLAKLPQLTQLSMARNSIFGQIAPVLGNLTKLSLLELSFSNLSGQIPVELGKLRQLSFLHLSYNQLTGPFPTFIGNLSKFYFLALESNMLTGSVPSTLGNLRYLSRLDIRMNHLHGNLDFLASLCNCRQLQILAISTNSFTGILPNYVGNLSKNLLEFTGINNKLTGGLPATLSNLSDLRAISFANNQLTKEIPDSIMMLENLQALDLSRNRMSGSVSAQIGMLRKIVMLLLNDNKFSGCIPYGLANLTMIEYIYLSYNHLSCTIPSILFYLNNLVTLSLSHNSLTGALPSDLGHMKAIDKIELSSNLLIGSLPSSFGQLAMLTYLNLSHNSFQDSIPASFDHLNNLATLDLSSNNLSGTIPKYFANFTYLINLNLSFNNLQGQIPNGGVFSNLTLQCLMGNVGLCGAPRLGFSPCLDNPHPTHGRHILKFILPAVTIAAGALAACLYLMIRKKNKKNPDVTTSSDMADVISHRLLSYHEIARATENFNEDTLIGVGSFAKVYKGQLDSGLVVAIKVLNMQVEQAARSFDAERQVLQMARHRNLIRILNTCSNFDFRALVLEYMPNGSLAAHLHTGNRNNQLGFVKRLDVMIGVSEAMEYLHHQHHQVVLHCDLKPSNVLFDAEMTAHVADFGIAKLLLGDDNSVVSASMLGTIGYMAPEYASVGKASRKSDVFSFGIMLLEVLCGKRPSDPMFTGELSLRQWVYQAFPATLIDVVDDKLLQDEEINICFDHQTDISLGTSSTSMTNNLLVSIFELGLMCSSESPEQRLAMNDVVAKLKNIKNGLVCRCTSNVKSTA
uniref:Uncharacterized protein n=1 Tax=Avena sativa TaxID=4498 RepID=A0ACD5TA34_AVESA